MTAVGVTNSETLFSSYLGAIRDGDRRRAFEIIDDARASGLDLGTLYAGVFQPALREIGRLWQENQITVADERSMPYACSAHA